jgi:RecJ-like exonuclease
MRNNSPEPDARPNITEYSVSEISLALKRTVEAAFGQVRVRGEISGFKRATSGHCYFKLKDEKAVLDAICWRGTKLDLSPEDGLEVICKGRVTTYPGRSNYQIVIEEMELAGEGALLKLLEARRKKLDGRRAETATALSAGTDRRRHVTDRRRHPRYFAPAGRPLSAPRPAVARPGPG